MSRRTRYIVYVDKAIMDKPTELFDAAFAHLVKKAVDIAKRKEFMAQFVKAGTDERRLEVINEWVQVRDVATFPYNQGKESAEAEDNTKADTESVEGDEEGSE